MNSIELFIFTVVGTTLLAGLSVMLYAALPQSILDYANRHGRFAGLGSTHQRSDTAGNAKMDVRSLQGQSA